MHASLKKVSTYCLLSSVSSLAAMTGGCEDAAAVADRKAEKAVQVGLTQMQKGEAAEASGTIKPVTTEQALSSLGKARAYGVLAESELGAARPLLDELTTTQVDAAAVAWQMDQLINKLASTTAMAGSYKSFNPVEPTGEVQKAIRNAQGAPDAPVWFDDPTGTGDLPSLSQVNQTISQLEGQITQRRQRIEELAKQRDDFNGQAQQTLDSANQMRGQEAVATFRRGTQLRQQAANVGSEIDQLNHQLMPLTHDLQVAQAHKKIVEEAIARHEQQNKALEESWKQINARMDEQSRIARDLLSGGRDTATIDQLAGLLDELVNKSTEQRDKANQHLTDAADYASQAASAAQQAGTDLSSRGQADANGRPAFDSLRATFDLAHYKLIQLRAQHRLAASHASQAALLGMQVGAAEKLDPLVKQGQMTLPQPLAQGDLPQRLAAARQAADEAFTKATELAQDIVDAPGAKPEQQGAAQVLKALNEHRWSIAKRSAGDAQAAQQHLAAARQAAQAAADLQVALPPLPPEIAPRAGAAPAGTTPPATPDATTPPAEPDAGTPAPDAATPAPDAAAPAPDAAAPDPQTPGVEGGQ